MIRHRDDRTHKRMERALHARFEKLMVDGSASQNIVIPAKAGIQVLNGSRAMRAISTANCGSPHRGRVSFFARAKKETKESTPRMAQRLPRLRGFGSRAAPTRHPVAAGQAQTSLSAPLRAPAQSLAVLGCAIRGMNLKNIWWNRFCYFVYASSYD